MTGQDIALIVAATAAPIAALYRGRAWLNWSKRCHPRNPSFRPPSVFGSRDDDG